MTDIIIGGILSAFSFYILIFFIKWSFDIVILYIRGIHTLGTVVRFETAHKNDEKWWNIEHKWTSKEERKAQWKVRKKNIEKFPIIKINKSEREIKLRVDARCKLNENIEIFLDPKNNNRFYSPKEKTGKITLIFAIIFLGIFGYFLIQKEYEFSFKYSFLNERNIMFFFSVILIILGILLSVVERKMINKH